MSQPQESPFNYFWENRYPFGYWYNRLEKINPHNDHDRIEALYSLVQLTDVYSHVFAAYAQNPGMPWFFLREETYRGDIDRVLDALRTEGVATVGSLSTNPDGLASFEATEEYDLPDEDAIAGAFLGCPYSVDEETMSVEWEEDPDIHRGVCNAILNFAEDHTALLNDFKHGFRILPVSPDDIEQFIGETAVVSDEDAEQFEVAVEELREEIQEVAWGFCFIRMHTERADYGYNIHLDVYQVDAWACYKFAELALDALNNLISSTGGVRLEDTLNEIPVSVLEGEETIMHHILGFATPVRDDPERVVAEDVFNPGGS